MRHKFGSMEGVSVVLVYVCLGLIVVCGILCAALFGQVLQLKTQLAYFGRDLAETKIKIGQNERIAREAADANEKARADSKNPTMRFVRGPLILSETDIQTIRQFIKVLPPQQGAQPKFSIGDGVTKLNFSPIPRELAEALPKLKDASFSIDQNSSILIVGAWSTKVDAVISYR